MNDIRTDSVWLMKGDCLERMKEIESGSVDAVISDIPYGISFADWDVLHDNTNTALLGASPAQEKSSLFKSRGKPLNGWSKEDKNIGAEFHSWCCTWLSEVLRITKPCSPVLIMCGRQLQHRFTLAAEDCGFIYKDYFVWDKVTAPFRAQRVDKVLQGRGIEQQTNDRLGNLAPMHEPIVYLTTPYKQGTTITDCYLKDKLGCFDADVATNNVIRVNSKVEGKVHETQKPTELMELLVKLVTKENHTVLDMFTGGGTTGVACMNTNRKFIGIEMDDHYFDIGTKRILETTKHE